MSEHDERYCDACGARLYDYEYDYCDDCEYYEEEDWEDGEWYGDEEWYD